MAITAITNTVVNKGFPNGTEWTLAQSYVNSEYGIRFINNSWYILGANGIWKSDDASHYVLWAFEGETVTSLIFVNNKFIAKIGNVIRYSEDNGNTWVEVALPKHSNFNGLIYAQGIYSIGAAWSIDLTNWTSTGLISNTLNNYTFYKNGVWFAVGTKSTASSERLWISLDGKNYNSTILEHGTYVQVEYANGIWIARDQGKIFRSLDAQDWAEVYNGNVAFGGLTYGLGMWIAYCRTSTSGAIYSVDNGELWRTGITNLRNRYNVSVKCANGIWVGGSSSSSQSSFWSLDGIHYNPINVNSHFTSIDYSRGIWTATTANNNVYISIGWQPI